MTGGAVYSPAVKQGRQEILRMTGREAEDLFMVVSHSVHQGECVESIHPLQRSMARPGRIIGTVEVGVGPSE